MIRVEKHRRYPQHYALRKSGLITRREMTALAGGKEYWWIALDAIWFKVKDGSTGVYLGTLRDLLDHEPASVEEAAECFADGRYGGVCQARLDDRGYWTPDGAPRSTIMAHLSLMEPLLEQPFTVPEGYDGWWHF